ncbi:prolyl 3-hydroxylase OGFOD1-like [Argonauta hians]
MSKRDAKEVWSDDDDDDDGGDGGGGGDDNNHHHQQQQPHLTKKMKITRKIEGCDSNACGGDGDGGEKATGPDRKHRLSINPRYTDPGLVEQLSRRFNEARTIAPDTNRCSNGNNNNNNSRSNNDTEYYSPSEQSLLDPSPFVHCVLPQFIREDQCLETLQGELQEVTFNEKNNDLYNFHQSCDLAHHSSPQISAFRQLFYTDVLQWMKKITNIELTSTVDLFCSIYEYTDVLLCHDDELEGRRIAFILYLVPPWDHTDGGSLDLFDTNELCQPRGVVKRVSPAWNQFTFFEVSPKSFHQVSEVLSKDKTRLSVSGWFHGPSLPPNPSLGQCSKLPLYPSLESETDILYSWVNPSYLGLEVQAEIQEKFELESEIQLQDFLRAEKYLAVNEAFLKGNIKWEEKGPANQRQYSVALSATQPDILTQCIDFLHSDIFFLFLSNLTGLKLHSEAAVSDDDDDDDDKKDDGSGGGGGNVKTEGNKCSSGNGSGSISSSSKGSHHGGDDEGGSSSSSKVSHHDGGGKGGSISSSSSSKVSHHDGGSSSSSKHSRHDGGGSSSISNSSSSSSKGSHDGGSSSSKHSRHGDNSKSDGGTIPESSRKSDSKMDQVTASSDLGSSQGEGQTQKGVTSGSSVARCSTEVRRWSHGCYTLLRDTEAQEADFALDAFLFFACEGWQSDYGGYISYIVKGEDEELLTVSPAHNSLALVYRDSETLHFVKHVNHRISEMPNQEFFDISLVYHE